MSAEGTEMDGEGPKDGAWVVDLNRVPIMRGGRRTQFRRAVT